MAGEIHELREKLSEMALDKHRAIASLMEELEAVDWYDQRAEIATNAELKEILEHNRDEEKEHAAMLMEWLRRNDEGWDKELRDYLFTTGPIGHHEDGEDDHDDGQDNASGTNDGSLGIGKG